MRKSLCAAALTLMLMPAMRVWAHHAFASEYDETKHVTVSGVVTEWKWTNPHVWMYVDQKDASGKVTRWSFEMGSANGMTTRGWKKTDVKAGDQITVEGFGAKDDSNTANAATVTLRDGRKLFGGFQQTPGAPVK